MNVLNKCLCRKPNKPMDQPVDWLTDEMNKRQTDQGTDKLTDWLSNGPTEEMTNRGISWLHIITTLI